MADVTLTPIGTGTTGVYQDGVNVNDNYYIANDGRVELIVDSMDTTTQRTMTIETGGTVEGLAIADRTVNLPTTASRLQRFGPFEPGIYNDSMGRLHITFSATDANVRFAPVRI